ncbi:MAG: NAD(+)/NADH kinase, partial [Phycisphaerales bacterium]|nr:NAD(+)/NADH kinase [Phycisphaerales bacterium]
NGATVTDTKGAEIIMVLGGDGTLLAQARRFADTGLPLVGVNLGHLGYLTGFDLDTLSVHAGTMLTSKTLETQERMLMSAEIRRHGKTVFKSAAMNDVVITAGPPYRMIEIGLRIADTDVRVIRGDGVVVATPIGSTAYNVSAGGPIVSPELEAMIVTAIAAHSLSFRPIVVEAASGIELAVLRANLVKDRDDHDEVEDGRGGTTLVLDGQVMHPVLEGDVISLTRHSQGVRLVKDPDDGYWETLVAKMHWAAPPGASKAN